MKMMQQGLQTIVLLFLVIYGGCGLPAAHGKTSETSAGDISSWYFKEAARADSSLVLTKLRQWHTLSIRSGDAEVRATAAFLMGFYHATVLGDIAGLELMQDAANDALDSGCYDVWAECMHHMGMLYYTRGNYFAGLQMLLQAHAYFAENNYTVPQAATFLLNLAYVQCQLGNYDECTELLHLADQHALDESYIEFSAEGIYARLYRHSKTAAHPAYVEHTGRFSTIKRNASLVVLAALHIRSVYSSATFKKHKANAHRHINRLHAVPDQSYKAVHLSRIKTPVAEMQPGNIPTSLLLGAPACFLAAIISAFYAYRRYTARNSLPESGSAEPRQTDKAAQNTRLLFSDDNKPQPIEIPDPLATIEQLRRSVIITDKDWQQFRQLFDQVYTGFFSRLRQKHPELTQAEIRLIALTKLNLSGKTMAGILGISPDSVRKTRYRIRKKILLEDDKDLEVFVGSV